MVILNPLQFSYVNAEFYGFDAEDGITFFDYLDLDRILSYVRGKRDDVNDDIGNMR